MTWKDVTVYSQSDSVRTPNSFVAQCGQFRLSVHHYYGGGDTWFASCTGIFKNVMLASKSIEDAQAEASKILTKILTGALEQLTGGCLQPRNEGQ